MSGRRGAVTSNKIHISEAFLDLLNQFKSFSFLNPTDLNLGSYFLYRPESPYSSSVHLPDLMLELSANSKCSLEALAPISHFLLAHYLKMKKIVPVLIIYATNIH